MPNSNTAYLTLLILLALAVNPANGATRRPAWAKHSMIASADSNATRAGLQILEAGGNAVDAACAVAMALGVTEGYSSGIGGGCFIVLHMADGRQVAIDGREVAPARASRLMFVPRKQADRTDLSLYSTLAAGVPGQVAALDLAVRDYGTMTFEELLAPAIALADTGFILDDYYASVIERYATRFMLDPASSLIYFDETGKQLAAGERLVQKDLAATLRRMAEHGAQEFYTGETAELIAEFMRKSGGLISTADLANYRPALLEPVRGTYRGFEVISMPPPSSGGIHLIQILNLLEGFPLGFLGAGSSESLHLIAESMCLAFADRAEFLGDPAFTPVPTKALISKTYADSLRGKVSRTRHAPKPDPGDPWKFESLINHHTTHFCVVDEFGNAASVTATVNTPFATCITVPGTGILLNNEMDDFVTEPGKANFFGLVGKAVNEIEPGKKPLSSMSPTIVLKDGQPYILAGGAGGPRIISATLLTIVNSIDYGMDIQAALDYPRIHQQWIPDRLVMEPEHTQDVRAGLEQRGHAVEVGPARSRVQAIQADTIRGGWYGAADSRGIGAALGQ